MSHTQKSARMQELGRTINTLQPGDFGWSVTMFHDPYGLVNINKDITLGKPIAIRGKILRDGRTKVRSDTLSTEVVTMKALGIVETRKDLETLFRQKRRHHMILGAVNSKGECDSILVLYVYFRQAPIPLLERAEKMITYSHQGLVKWIRYGNVIQSSDGKECADLGWWQQPELRHGMLVVAHGGKK